MMILDAIPVVSLRQVARVYPGPPEVSALMDVDLSVGESEYLAVMGASGSGKSTLLNILGLLDRPTAGTYLLDGLDTATLKERERTHLRGTKIGFVFQSFHLIPYRDAVENVELALMYNNYPPARRSIRAQETLAQVGLSHRASALPNQLSGGERQRIAIARALVHEPLLVLCDEPTGNLDSKTSGMILDLLDDLHAAGNTIIVITHDPVVARRAGRSIELSDGRIAETGQQLLESQ